MADSSAVHELLERLENPTFYMETRGRYTGKVKIPTDPQYALLILAKASLGH